MIDYVYRCSYVRAIDGDTVDLQVDLGFHVFRRQRFRMLGLDTPELNSADLDLRVKAKLAKIFVEEELTDAKEILVKSYKDRTDKYGRYLADVTYTKEDGLWHNLSQRLIAEGLGEPYAGE